MKHVVWSRRARRELEEQLAFLATLDASLPDRMLDRVEAAVATLLDHPRLGPAVPDSTVRQWIASGTPFVLFYRPARDGVRVLTLWHSRSDWQEEVE